jgi:steroid delta-isomerase-like uncharacterized protein
MRTVRAIARLSVVATLAMVACTTSQSSAAQKQNEVIARQIMAIWQTGDTSAVFDLFRPDAVYDDFPQQQQYQGIEEIIGHLTSLQSWATNISMDVGEVHAGPTSAVAEWTLSLVQDRPMGNLVPMATNKSVVISGVTVFEIQRGEVTRAADYWDASQLAIQLGGKVVFPGGATWPTGDTTAVGGGAQGR